MNGIVLHTWVVFVLGVLCGQSVMLLTYLAARGYYRHTQPRPWEQFG